MKVLFYAQHLYYLPQFVPVAEAMSRQHEVSFGYPRGLIKAEEAILAQAIHSRGWTLYAPPESQMQAQQTDVLIIGASKGVEDLAGPSTLVVLLFHSIGLKRVYYTDTHPRINIRFIESEYHRKRCLEYTPDTEIHAVGFAKLDPIFNKTGLGDSPLFSTAGPKILYAPTFYPGSLELLGKLIPSWPREWQIVIKPHQFTITNSFYQYQLVMLRALTRSCPNVTLLPLESYNILPAFDWADVLVSDVSSTLIEFTALDRPIVACDQVHLRLHHRWRGGRYFRRRLDTELLSKINFAHHASTADLVAGTIRHALGHPDALSSKRLSGRDLLVGPSDGQASQRIKAIIEHVVA